MNHPDFNMLGVGSDLTSSISVGFLRNNLAFGGTLTSNMNLGGLIDDQFNSWDSSWALRFQTQTSRALRLHRPLPAGASAAHAREIKRFVEKPGGDIALDLLRRGALWNTMILAARGRTLWAMADRGIPEVCWLFMTYRALIGHRSADGFLRDIYSRLPFTDLNRDIFRVAAGLGVISMLHPAGR